MHAGKPWICHAKFFSANVSKTVFLQNFLLPKFLPYTVYVKLATCINKTICYYSEDTTESHELSNINGNTNNEVDDRNESLNSTYDSFVKWSKKGSEIIVAILFLIVYYIQSLDDYEWICITDKAFCGSSENFVNLSIIKTAVTITSIVLFADKKEAR